jgi:hypothetical protein
VKPSKQDPVILTLDGHYSHSRNIEVIDCAWENAVGAHCLTAQITLKMKLLDVSFLQPLKTNHAQEIQIWLKNHSNRVVTRYQITGLVGESLLEIGQSSYCCKRVPNTHLVFHCNIHVFDERDPGRISAQQHQLLA